MDNTVLDKPTLEEARAIMKAKFADMITYYIEDAEQYINMINTALDSNLPEAIIAAHSLKSSSRQVGAFKLSDIAKAIEEGGRSEDRASIHQLLPRLSEAFTETCTALKNL